MAPLHQIQDRLNEITFNGALISEMRAIDFVNRLIDSGKRDDYMRLFVHRIDGGRHLESFPASSNLDASWSLIGKLHGLGREAAKHTRPPIRSGGREPSICGWPIVDRYPFPGQ
jgi:hypothetical protein